MKKIYQTIVDKDKGDCMQAVFASLFEKELDEIPNFIENKDGGGLQMMQMFFDLGYDPTYINKGIGDSTEFMKRIAKFDGGIDGFFYATVPSQTYKDVGHAVIVNENLEIVHDPNPNQKALELTPDDVIGIYSMSRMVVGKTGKLFTQDEKGRSYVNWNSNNKIMISIQDNCRTLKVFVLKNRLKNGKTTK